MNRTRAEEIAKNYIGQMKYILDFCFEYDNKQNAWGMHGGIIAN